MSDVDSVLRKENLLILLKLMNRYSMKVSQEKLKTIQDYQLRILKLLESHKFGMSEEERLNVDKADRVTKEKIRDLP